MNYNNIDIYHYPWKIKAADWAGYEKAADEILSKSQFNSNPTNLYSNFINFSNEAALINILKIRPYIGKKFRKLLNPWWDKECVSVKKLKLEAIKNYIELS